MRVLHVIHDMSPEKGGPPEHLLQLSYGYAAIGVTMEVLSLDAPDAPYLQRYPFPIHAFGPDKSVYGRRPAAAVWLREHTSDYDGILIDGLWFYLGSVARKAALAAGIPYIIFPHGALDPWFRGRYPGKHLKKMLYWWAVQRRIVRDARRIVFTTEIERRLAEKTFWPYHASTTVIPLGTRLPSGDPDLQRAAFFAQTPALEGRRFLLFLSRIHEKKGCDLLLKAFAQIAPSHPDLDLVLAGPGEPKLIEQLQGIARTSGIADRVHWPGMLEGDVKWGAFRAAEVFVLPSHQENFGIVVAEAIACGLPVLLSNKVNIWEWIVEDGAGIADEDTEAGTVRLLTTWLQMSPESRQAMRDRTAACFHTRFALETCARNISNLVTSAEEPAYAVTAS